MKSQLEEIKKKVHETSIHISTNLRKEEKTRFVELAKTEFNGDYATTLRWLLDFREGILSNPNEQLSDKIDLLANEIAQVKQSLEKPKEPEIKIKTLSGRIIKIEK